MNLLNSSVGELFNLANPDLYFLIVLSIVNALVMCFLSNKFTQIIQISNYRIRAYGVWLKDTKVKWVGRISILAFLSFLCVYTTNSLLNQFLQNKLLGYLGLIFYFAFAIIFMIELHKIPQKKPLKLTKRMFRLYVVLYILYLAITFGVMIISLLFSYNLRVSVMALLPIAIPILVPFAALIIYPIERIIYVSYKNKCKKELKKHKDLIKIGITGSYGKTSTKDYLVKFLESKYKVCTTPSSYNTPMGICKVVLNDLTEEDQVFVVEMGANRVGDIKELCNMVEPNMGIITAVGEQHLETFYTLENIIKTKSELYESLPEDAVCVFNVSNDNTKQMYRDCQLKHKVAVGGKKNKLSAKNIVATKDGLEFTVCYEKQEYTTKTKILGEHNVQNIMCAAALALELGVSIKEILNIIPNLEPVEHRLQLKKLDNDILVIDDSFNGNIQGTAVALKTLKLFTESRKIIVTPGLVELGKKEDSENIEFGKRIADACDLAILVGKNQSENIKKGLLAKKFKEENIIMAQSLFEVTNMFKSVLQAGDVVLLENDLPDNYK